MPRVLFVCFGNIGRSQMAEAFYNHFTKSSDAWSAATNTGSPESFSHPTGPIVQVMREEGIDVSKQKVTALTKEMIKSSDRVFVLCKKGNCPSYLLNSRKVTFWDVEDPYFTDLEGVRRIRDEIKEKVLSVIILYRIM